MVIDNNKVLKAKRLVAFKKIVRILGSSVGKERYSVTGENDTYDVVFDSRKNIWTCSCPNIKNVYCYHIIAASIFGERFYKDEDCVNVEE